jgi:hypothetical protein
MWGLHHQVDQTSVLVSPAFMAMGFQRTQVAISKECRPTMAYLLSQIVNNLGSQRSPYTETVRYSYITLMGTHLQR